MRVRYNREVDVLTIELSDDEVDYAEEAGPMIIHFSKNNKPVIVEILDASEFLAELTRISIKTRGRERVEIEV